MTSESVYDIAYPPPRGNVLLLSCMDLRLLDDIVRFMNHDNLCNRYDQVVFAGAALGALGGPRDKKSSDSPTRPFKHWRRAFKDHVKAAIELHNVQDIYILEHRNCGAYSKVFGVTEEEYGESLEEQDRENDDHFYYASKLERLLQRWTPKVTKNGKPLPVHKFLMDLRGGVAPLKPSK